jgi:hypothetical protein
LSNRCASQAISDTSTIKNTLNSTLSNPSSSVMRSFLLNQYPRTIPVTDTLAQIKARQIRWLTMRVEAMRKRIAGVKAQFPKAEKVP